MSSIPGSSPLGGFTCARCGKWVAGGASHNCGGYNCPTCSTWVGPGTTHQCNGVTQNPFQSLGPNAAELRIATSLEMISFNLAQLVPLAQRFVKALEEEDAPLSPADA